MTIQYHSGVALAKKKGKDIHIVETPVGIGDMLPVAAAGTTYPRQLRYRFADVVNVKDFGAAGAGKLAYDGTIKYYDGATDDADAIQAAISACERRGGGTVLIPPGIYMCSHTLNLPS